MIKDGLNGDKYLFGVLVYNGKRKAPVRWLEMLGYVGLSAIFLYFVFIWIVVEQTKPVL